jgi:hypothetical protein
MTKRRPLTELAAEAKVDAPVKPAPAKKSTKTAGKGAAKQRAPKSAGEKAAAWSPSTKPKPLRELDADSLAAMNLRLPKEMHKRLQFQRIEEGRPMNDLIVEAIHDYLRRASGPAR